MKVALRACAKSEAQPVDGRHAAVLRALWGDADRSYRWPQVEALRRGLPDSRLAIIPGTAHADHLGKSGLFQAIVADVLQPSATPKAGLS